MSTSINPSLYLENAKQQTTNKNKTALGKDEFLKILMTQLQNQDPLKPMEDKEFIAQMAQFSALEQMTNMSQAMQKFIEFEKKNSIASYTPMIGKNISWEREIKVEGEDPVIESGQGIVSSLQFNNDVLQYKLNDGTTVNAEHILQVNGDSGVAQQQVGDQGIALASQMIGKKVTYLENDQEIESIVESVQVKEGKMNYILNNGSIINNQQIQKVSQANE